MQTIGQRLKQAREAKRLTFDEVFEGTRIRIAYLRALEEDDLSAMPSPVQARGYLRNYAEFLGLDFDRMLEEMRGQAQSAPSSEMITPMDVPPSTESAAVDAPSTEEAPRLSKPKTVRRKKSDSQPVADEALQTSLEPNTALKRRGRKSVEPESVQEVQAEPAAVEESAEVQHTESLTVEQPNQADVNETLWQTWLNRLSSIVSVSSKVDTQSQETSASEETADQVASTVEVDQLEQDAAGERQLRSKEIFIEIGAELRRQREFLSLHLDEVERNTHVKAHYITALEDGAMDNLPSTVQTRGMLSNYATFLDLDVDSILLRYADALQARYRERNPQKPARAAGEPIVSRIPPIRSFIAGDIVFGFGVAILLIGFTIWGVSRVMTIMSEEDVEPTAPSISDVLLATTDPSLFTPTATLAPVEGGLFVPTVTIVIPTQNLNVSVQVNLIAVERTYMRVIADGEEVFNGRVLTGNAYPFEAETQIEVLVGSGAAIRVVHNGRDLGLMGDFGQVVNNIYLEEEVTTPTALPTQSPTITLTPTATERPSATPIPSSTAVPTRTP